jgi:hypothetical protein
MGEAKNALIGGSLKAMGTVYVWGIPHVVTVHQKSGTMWVAVGNYRDERIEVKGSSANVAAKWVEADSP